MLIQYPFKAQWVNFMTFDIIGDLTFGRSFGCLESGKLHPWIALLPGAARTMTFLLALKHAPYLVYKTVVAIVMPFLSVRREHQEFTNDKIRDRLSDEIERSDFITPILKCVMLLLKPPTTANVFKRFAEYFARANDEKGMTYPELESSINLLVTAGKGIPRFWDGEVGANTLKGAKR